MTANDSTDNALIENESVKKDVSYMQKISVVIGSLSIVFSLVFIWNASELGKSNF